VSFRRSTVAAVFERLAPRVDAVLAKGQRPLVATDADGTLWTSDVGEATFLALLDAGRLLPAARDALVEEARAHGVEIDERDDASALCRRLWAAYERGRVPGERMCAAMAYCVGGHRWSDACAFAAEALEPFFAAPNRLIDEQWRLLEALSSRGARIVVVSASPTWVVEPAVAIARRLRPLPIDAVVALDVEVEAASEQILARTRGVIPYGPGKCARVTALVGAAHDHWLAAMGDNRFDAAMLEAAEHGFAVRPKPALVALSSSLPDVVELAG
jgi:phosphoserine phosphatase